MLTIIRILRNDLLQGNQTYLMCLTRNQWQRNTQQVLKAAEKGIPDQTGCACSVMFCHDSTKLWEALLCEFFLFMETNELTW